MSLTIDLCQELEAVLASQARAARMDTERYLARIIERALKTQHGRAVKDLQQQLDQMAAQVLPETTSEEMEAALEAALAAVRPRRSWHQ
jgi:hypothetical protein